MKGFKYIMGILMMLIGVISVNAIPYVPHHHHDGKICVEQDEDVQDCQHDDAEPETHSEEGEYDVPQVNMRFEEDIPIDLLPQLLSIFNLQFDQGIKRDKEPEKTEVFRENYYSAISQELRGSPFFSC